MDTNFVMIPFQFKVDVITELERLCDFKYKLCVIDRTIDELNKIAKEDKKFRNREAAKMALKMIKANKIKIIKTRNGHADDILAEMDGIIATQDKELRKRVEKAIVLRKKKYLEFV